MDVVLALTMKWKDSRLKWDANEWGEIPITSLSVDSSEIWNPAIDIANRIHDFSPATERFMKSTVNFKGEKNSIN